MSKISKLNLLCQDCRDEECDGTECNLGSGQQRSMTFQKSKSKITKVGAYKAMTDLFYGNIFGIVPKNIINDCRQFFMDKKGISFDLYCVEQEGWTNLNEVHEFASMIKPMTKKERTKFMVKCPSKVLKQFVKEHL